MGTAGRVCVAGGCSTILRRSNPGDRCELHRRAAEASPVPSWLPPSLDPEYVLVPMSPAAFKRRVDRVLRR